VQEDSGNAINLRYRKGFRATQAHWWGRGVQLRDERSMDEDAGVIIEAVEGRGLVEEEGDGTIGVPDNCASFEKVEKRQQRRTVWREIAEPLV
jgi:hypothetical protein